MKLIPTSGSIEEFLDRLVRVGIRVDIQARIRVARVMGALPPNASPGTIRDSLHACLVSSRNQSAAFDEAVAPLLRTSADPSAAPTIGARTNDGLVEGPGSRPTDSIAPKQKPTKVKKPVLPMGTLAAAAVLLGLGLVGASLNAGALSALAQWLDVIAEALRHLFYPPPPCDAPCSFYPRPQPGIVALLAFVTGLCLSAWAILWIRRARGQKHDSSGSLPQDPMPTPLRDASHEVAVPIFQPGLIGGLLVRLSPSDVEAIADLIACAPGERDEERIDLEASINRTVRSGGLAEIVHPLQARVRRVLIVEDGWSTGRYWNPIGAELAEGLASRGVEVEHIPFFGTFADLGGRGGAGTPFAGLLEILEALCPAIVFVITDGAHLRASDVKHLLLLDEVAPVIWLDHREESVWDGSLSVPLAAGVQVAEASAKGILGALTALERGEPRTGARRRPIPRLDEAVRHALAALGPARSWAADCCLIQPIGPGLAEALRRKFHAFVDPMAFARMVALDGVVIGEAGLVFPPHLEEMLARDFRRREPALRRRVAAFIGDAIVSDLEGWQGQEGATYRDASEWTRLRAELIAEASATTVAAIRRLAADSDTLRRSIRADLGRLTREQGAKGPVIPVRDLGDLGTIESLTGMRPTSATTANFFTLDKDWTSSPIEGTPDGMVGAIVPDVGAVVVAHLPDGTSGKAILTVFGDNGQTLQTAYLPEAAQEGGPIPLAVAAGAGMLVVAHASDRQPDRVELIVYRLDVASPQPLDVQDPQLLKSTLPIDRSVKRPVLIAFDADGGTALVTVASGLRHLAVRPNGERGVLEEAIETTGPLIDALPSRRGSGFLVAIEPARLELWRSSDGRMAREPIEASLVPIQRLVPSPADGEGPLAFFVPSGGGLVSLSGGGAVRSERPAEGAIGREWVAQAGAIQIVQSGDAAAVVLPDSRFGIVNLATGLDVLDGAEAAGETGTPFVRPLDGPLQLLDADLSLSRQILSGRTANHPWVIERFSLSWDEKTVLGAELGTSSGPGAGQ